MCNGMCWCCDFYVDSEDICLIDQPDLAIERGVI